MVACVAVFAVQLARGWRGFDESPPFQLQVFWEVSWPLLRAGLKLGILAFLPAPTVAQAFWRRHFGEVIDGLTPAASVFDSRTAKAASSDRHAASSSPATAE